MFAYVRNQYILGRFKPEDLSILVGKGFITEEEMNLILGD
jgi:hypothetical protein